MPDATQTLATDAVRECSHPLTGAALDYDSWMDLFGNARFVLDTTGAGDAFAGGLAVAVLKGRSLRDAACFATAASHATVTKYGSQPAYPTRSELLDR
jgi:bifunctional ADP-heptose synthase (sugar kinase/adenylyltransferase)